MLSVSESLLMTALKKMMTLLCVPNAEHLIIVNATRKTQNNQYVCNVAATMDGVEVPTDMSWGGSSFNNIGAGEEVEIIIYFKKRKKNKTL